MADCNGFRSPSVCLWIEHAKTAWSSAANKLHSAKRRFIPLHPPLLSFFSFLLHVYVHVPRCSSSRTQTHLRTANKRGSLSCLIILSFKLMGSRRSDLECSESKGPDLPPLLQAKLIRSCSNSWLSKWIPLTQGLDIIDYAQLEFVVSSKINC